MENSFWFTLKVFGGQENVVKTAIEEKLKNSDASRYVLQIFFPEDEIIEIKNKKKVVTYKPVISGYIFMEVVVMNPKIRQLLRNVSGFLGFLTENGYSKTEEPIPMNKKDIDSLHKKAEIKLESVDTVLFEEGDYVKVIDGPFKDKVGKVSKVYAQKKRLSVIDLLDIAIPVELSCSEVIKQ